MRLLGGECAFYQLPRMRLSVVRQARAFLQNPESWDFHRGLLVIHPF